MASACRLDTIYANALFYVYVHGFIYEYGRDWVEDEDRGRPRTQKSNVKFAQSGAE